MTRTEPVRISNFWVYWRMQNALLAKIVSVPAWDSKIWMDSPERLELPIPSRFALTFSRSIANTLRIVGSLSACPAPSRYEVRPWAFFYIVINSPPFASC